MAAAWILFAELGTVLLMVSLSLAESVEGIVANEWPSRCKVGKGREELSRYSDEVVLRSRVRNKGKTPNLHRRHNCNSLQCILQIECTLKTHEFCLFLCNRQMFT